MPLLRSLKYIKKSKGPKIEPCGTPASTGVHAEIGPFSTTRWSLLFRKLWVSFSGNSVIPIHSILWMSPSCHILSKAFDIYKKTALTPKEGLQSNDANVEKKRS